MESASFRAVRQVLTWASDQGMTIRGLLSAEQLESLARVFSGNEPWRFDWYEPLRAFSHAIPRLNLPDAPAAMHLGDALEALGELLQARYPSWPTQPSVSERTFAELGYAATSAGISRLRDKSAAAWRDHGVNNKELLLRGAELAKGARAAVIGAGKLYDIPLRKLAERFEQVLLVDIDEPSLTQSVAQSGLDPELRKRLMLISSDVTGINDTFLHRARAALEIADERAAYEGLLGLFHGYCLAEPPLLFPGSALPDGGLDFVCSSMVLSQLATPLTRYVEQTFAQRFPESTLTQAHEFQVALAQFTHRLQHAHITSLLAAAPCMALTSDIAEQYTHLDPYGKINASQALPLIGAPHLEDLIPVQRAQVLTSSEWSWERVVPTRSHPHGRLLKVVGVVAQR
jgi:hypothetical protein